MTPSRSASVRCRRRWLLASAVLALLPVPAASLFAQETPGGPSPVLYGQVVDARSREPIASAEVQIASLQRTVLTDTRGRFLFSDVEPGSYEVAVQRIGYQSVTKAWEVGAAPKPLSVELEPDPVLLEGIRITQSRLHSRMNAVGMSTRVVTKHVLAYSPAPDVEQLLKVHAGLRPVLCHSLLEPRFNRDGCYVVRGQPTTVIVCIDERSAPGGMVDLRYYRPWEVERIEIYGGGRHVKVYTTQFLEWAAKQRYTPMPYVPYAC